MKPTNLLILVVILALCAMVSRQTAKPAGEPHKLLIGRWRAVDLPPMCFSWDYQFRADGTGTQFHDNGAVMETFRYVFDGHTLTISSRARTDGGPAPLRFIDVDNFELADYSRTVRFKRRLAAP